MQGVLKIVFWGENIIFGKKPTHTSSFKKQRPKSQWIPGVVF